MKSAATKATLLLFILLLLAACAPQTADNVVVNDGTADYEFKLNAFEVIDAYCLAQARVVCFVHRNATAPTVSCVPYNEVAGGFSYDIDTQDFDSLFQTPTICGDE